MPSFFRNMKIYTEKAKKFYNSTKWKKTKNAYKASKFGFCERCGKPNAEIVHHKEYLNDVRLDDADYTLNFENLELLCIDCHNREHFEKYSLTVEGTKFDENGNLVRAE